MEKYPQTIEDYINRLNASTQEKCKAAISDLRQRNLPWLWIQMGLELKKPEDWEKWGFGLMFSDSFKAQVDKKHDAAKRTAKQAVQPQEPAEDDRAWCLAHERQLLALLSCGSWGEVRSKLEQGDSGQAPKWYHRDADEWYPTTAECFESIDPRASVIGREPRNAPAIRYALESGFVCPQHEETWREILKKLGENE